MTHPYDEYVSKVLSEIDALPNHKSMSRTTFGEYLADAWMAGLAHSLNLIEGENEKRFPWEVRLHDAPKVFSGGKMQEPIIYENTSLYGGNQDVPTT